MIEDETTLHKRLNDVYINFYMSLYGKLSVNTHLLYRAILKSVCISDLRILTGSSEPESDSASATILTSSLDQIDIYSNSYIHPPVQAGLYPIGKEVLRALKRGTTEVIFKVLSSNS